MRHEQLACAPARVYWELTRACDLACRQCRAEATPERAPDDLTTEACERVLRRLAAAGPPPPHVVFTGGDPMKRPDLAALVKYGAGLGLGISVAATATPAVSREAVAALKDGGVAAMSLSLDGSSPARHDGIRGVFGCFGWTLVAAQRIVNAGIMFIAANGDVMPSGFLPVTAGNIRDAEAIDIYRYASVFRALRAPETFHGRCGACDFRMVCGGSRARAYAVTGDFLAEDPLCAYELPVMS